LNVAIIPYIIPILIPNNRSIDWYFESFAWHSVEKKCLKSVECIDFIGIFAA
jgi:hypothetical protein